MDFSSIDFSSLDFSSLDFSSMGNSGMDVSNWIALIGILVAVISAIAAAGASIYQSLSAKKSNKETLELQKKLALDSIEANIISKARIEWIQEARVATTNFITECSNLIFTVLSPLDGVYEPKNKDEVKKKLSSINNTANLLILYFGTDYGENDEIVTMIEDIRNSLTDNNNEYCKSNEFLRIENEIKKLRDILRVYFKKEWLRVSNLKELNGNKEKKKKIKDSYIQNNYSLEELRHKKEYLQIERTNVKNSAEYKSAKINQILNETEYKSNKNALKSKHESERNILLSELELIRKKLKSKQNGSNSNLDESELNHKIFEIEIKLVELDKNKYGLTSLIINIISIFLAITALFLSFFNIQLSFLSIFFIILLIPIILVVRYLSVLYLNKKIREERIKTEKIINDLIGRLEDIDLEIEIVDKAIEYLEKQDKNN